MVKMKMNGPLDTGSKQQQKSIGSYGLERGAGIARWYCIGFAVLLDAASWV